MGVIHLNNDKNTANTELGKKKHHSQSQQESDMNDEF
jgi:hypothetical protein